MKVIAVHGDFATGEQLRYDMGDPPWVDHYITAKTFDRFAAQVPQQDVVLIGYSRGAEWVREVTNFYWCSRVIRIRGVVGYEPLAEGNFVAVHTIPRLLIHNHRGRAAWTRLGEVSLNRWRGPNTTELQGKGFHVRLKTRPPFIGHAWDQSLNPQVEKWIQELQD